MCYCIAGSFSLLAGDHLQLPPTVMSEAAAKAGLSNTLFERLQGSLGPAASCMLTVQYRMNAAIMDWSSQELYGVSLPWVTASLFCCTLCSSFVLWVLRCLLSPVHRHTIYPFFVCVWGELHPAAANVLCCCH
jgi:hypothetical protein